MAIKRLFAKADLEVTNYTGKDYIGCSEAEANLVTSQLLGNRHAPVLDIDVPHRLVPSSTPGHSHLYIDVECNWNDYAEFLRLAAKIGFIEDGYYRASIARGFTAVRKDGVYKTVKDTSS